MSPDPAAERFATVVVIGGGQAGLSMSRCLKEQGIEHVVLERHTVAHSWKEDRWESFCLVTPNWQCNLPGWSYSGSDPHGFMVKDTPVEQLVDAVRRVHQGLRVVDPELAAQSLAVGASPLTAKETEVLPS